MEVKFLEHESHWEIEDLDGQYLGKLEKRQGMWAYSPHLMCQTNFLRESELLAIFVKVARLNKSNNVIVIGA